MALINWKIHVWDVETGKGIPLVEELKSQRSWLIDDGKVLVVVKNDNSVHGTDLDTNAEAFTWSPAKAQSDRLKAIAFSADGKWAACGGHMGEITLRDARTGKVLARQNLFDRTVGALGFSPDCKRLGATDDQRRLKVWTLGPIAVPDAVAETRIAVDPNPAPPLPAESK